MKSFFAFKFPESNAAWFEPFSKCSKSRSACQISSNPFQDGCKKNHVNDDDDMMTINTTKAKSKMYQLYHYVSHRHNKHNKYNKERIQKWNKDRKDKLDAMNTANTLNDIQQIMIGTINTVAQGMQESNNQKAIARQKPTETQQPPSDPANPINTPWKKCQNRSQSLKIILYIDTWFVFFCRL